MDYCFLNKIKLNMNDFTLIIDFDSTFVSVEGLVELSKICLRNNPHQKDIVKKIDIITQLGMEGKISFSESLNRRFALFKPTKCDIEQLIYLLNRKITPSVKRNRQFFQKYAKQIYIISGGFREWIEPVVEKFGILKSNILANELIFNVSNEVIGYDCKNILSQEKGKVKQVQHLNFHGIVYVLGDGFTDYEIKQAGLAAKFIVLTENIRRSEVVEKADREVKSFDEFFQIIF